MPATPPVPLCDIGAQYRALQPQIDAAVLRVLGSGQAILGPEAAAFRTRAVIPVHLFGQCADMRAIKEVADRYAVRVVEDAAQSFGAEYQGTPCGGLGDLGCFSFYPSKNLGTFGDAGMVTTNDDHLAVK